MTFDSRSIVPVFFLFPLGGALRSSQGSGRAGGWGGLCFSSLASLCCLQPDLTGMPLHGEAKDVCARPLLRAGSDKGTGTYNFLLLQIYHGTGICCDAIEKLEYIKSANAGAS